MTVKAILAQKSPSVVTIAPHATLRDAVRLLAERRIGAVVVTSAGDRVAGLLSERDIVRVLAQRGVDALDLPVSEVMTRKVVTCSERDAVSELMERMTHGKFRHLPVVAAERLVGIVSIGDIVKHRLGEMEAEQSAMREYIATA